MSHGRHFLIDVLGKSFHIDIRGHLLVYWSVIRSYTSSMLNWPLEMRIRTKHASCFQIWYPSVISKNIIFKHAGRSRVSEIPGRILKKPSSTAAKELPTLSDATRKPLSPVSFAVSSKANILNFLKDDMKQRSGNDAFPVCKTLPDELASASNENGITPKRVQVKVPATPSTPVPMVVASTPATPAYFSARKLEKLMEPVEYSFEEFRVGFLSQNAY